MIILINFLFIINLLHFCKSLNENTPNSDIINIGITERKLKEYEGQHILKNGIVYNSFLIIAKKILIIDVLKKNTKMNG